MKDGDGRRIAILGDMGELGEVAAALHREVGTFAGKCRIDKLICAGPLCTNMVSAAKAENPEMETVHYDTLEQLMQDLEQEVQQGDTILVKASHFMQFEKVLEKLQK